MLVIHILRTAAVEQGHAARKYTKKKMTKYSSEVLLDGSIPTFRPLIFEHFGLWGDGALNYLTELSKKSKS